MSETLQDFEIAREERLWDGVSLWCSSRFQGTIYMFGYHAEMSLKSAYLRFRGETAATEISRPLLRTCSARARLLGVTTPPESFHSLRFWRDLLVAERATTGNSLPDKVGEALHNHVEALYSRWSVQMRYKVDVATFLDVEVSAAAAEWIDRNHHQLYLRGNNDACH